MTILIVLIIFFALGLVFIGFFLENNPSIGVSSEMKQDEFADILTAYPRKNRLQTLITRFQESAKIHPHPLLASIETLIWLLLVIALMNHVLYQRGGLVASITWFLVIGPHEVGHLICNPFGRFIMVLGGSIWQVLFWALLMAYVFFIKRKLVQALLMLQVVGHSFIDMAVYIRDAQERDLPLILGMGPEYHDWGYLLDRLNLTQYDNFLAGIAVAVGVSIIIIGIVMGIFTTWTAHASSVGFDKA